MNDFDNCAILNQLKDAMFEAFAATAVTISAMFVFITGRRYKSGSKNSNGTIRSVSLPSWFCLESVMRLLNNDASQKPSSNCQTIVLFCWFSSKSYENVLKEYSGHFMSFFIHNSAQIVPWPLRVVVVVPRGRCSLIAEFRRTEFNRTG